MIEGYAARALDLLGLGQISEVEAKGTGAVRGPEELCTAGLEGDERHEGPKAREHEEEEDDSENELDF